MRHILMIVSAFVLAQGTALADGMPDVPPPPDPKPANSCPAPTDSKEYKELVKALQSSEDDVKALLKDGCNEAIKQEICAKHPDWEACKPPAPKTKTVTTDKVEHRTTSKHVDKPKTPKVEAPPPSYIDIEKVDVTAGVTVRCVRLVKWQDRNRNGKHDDGETVQTDQVCNGKDGRDGKDGKNGLNGHDGKNGRDGKDGSSGRPGVDGNTRIQVGLGARAASVFSAHRPIGRSLSPELEIDYWLSPTVEFDLGTAWAASGDRNMVVTGELCRRGLNSMFGLCFGGQYQAWNLQGNLALWQSGFAVAAIKFVPVETSHVDLSFELGGGVGFDGYDAKMQFAGDLTGGASLSVKF